MTLVYLGNQVWYTDTPNERPTGVNTQAVTVELPTRTVFYYSGTAWNPGAGGAGGSGEVNTASNIGTGGVGVFKQKNIYDLQFKKINAGNTRITIADDTANNEVDIALSEANVLLQNLGGTLPYSKMNLSNSIVDTDISPIATIAYSKLTLADSIGNADIAPTAGIQYSKLLFTEANGIKNTDINTSASIAYSKVSLNNSIVNSDINSGAAIQYSKLNLTGGLVDADLNATAAITWTKVNKFGSKLNDLDDVTIGSSPATGDVPTWNGTGWANAPPPGAGGGEANTITNIGTGGVGLFKVKTGTNLELKNINAGSTKVTVTDDTIASEVDIDVAATVVSTDQANTFGDVTQQFRSGKLELRDSNNSHSYVIAGSDIAANRTVTIPVLTDHDTFDMLGTAQTITGTKTFVSSGIRIKDSDGSHAYTIVGSDLAGDTILTLPLFSGTDTLVTQALLQTLTNKNIDATAGVNTITNIGDSAIALHTSSKITIGAKGQLNTQIVYKDQANTYNAAFDQFFPTSRLLVGSSDGSSSYAFAGSAIAAPRTITLPLLTGPDTFVTQAFAQPITNKTINVDANTIKHSTTNAAGDLLVNDGTQFGRLAKGSANQVLAVNSGGTGLTWAASGGPGGGEANTASNIGTAGVGVFKVKSDVDLQFKKINAGSTKVTITDDTTNNEVDIDLGSQVVATDQANTFGAFNQTFPSGRFLLGDLDGLQSYTFVGSNLAANRLVTWPALGSNDVVVLEAHAQTLTNKIIHVDSNTIKHSSTNTAGDILVSNGTQFDRLARGSANQVLGVNAGDTNIAWTTTLANITLTTPTINGIKRASVVKTGAYTLLTTDTVIRADASSSAFTLTLPTASGNVGLTYTIIRTDTDMSTNALTVDGNAAETIGGSLTHILYPSESLIIECDGSNWQVISEPTPNTYYYRRGGATADRRYFAGVGPAASPPATSTTGPAANILFALPFIVPRRQRFDLIEVEVMTAGAGSNIRLGIYRDDGNMYPGALLFDSGNLSAASTGTKSATITSSVQIFQPGLYWLTYENSATVPQIRMLNTGAANPWHAVLGFNSAGDTNSQGLGWTVAHTVGALPNPYTAGATVRNSSSAAATPLPAIGMRPI